jgi:hypothetical protein
MYDPLRWSGLRHVPVAARSLAPFAVTVVVIVACSDTPFVAPSHLTRPSGTIGSMAMTSCGASFRMISSEEDSLMAPYGIPNTVDTVDVCEAWTGSDYAYQATAELLPVQWTHG